MQADCKPEFTALPEEFTAHRRSAVDHDRVSGSGRGGSGESSRDANAHTTSTVAPTTRHTSTAFRTRPGALSPESWTAARDRCRAVGIGDNAELATKPVLAQNMIERALDAEVRFAWLTADEAYGQMTSGRAQRPGGRDDRRGPAEAVPPNLRRRHA
ncbi:hypothetical protein EP51_40110 (plasmid) [Rhodococcus opacus]|uniref:Transposase IS701-like DDE domain-containing protein n=1 Tax=Rhodococcus opacus TaxID=37919 RepID=A0A076EYI1_RHOOP|nr:hypothetical protein EP51_40110 [Rhodococcus opacus]